MQPNAIPHVGFDGVAEGMPKVEGGSHARLTLISTDNGSLGRTGATNRFSQGNLIQATQRIHICFEPSQERFVTNQAVLDHFSKAC
ncbi:hypothetical protein D3C72_1035920 [compost metagenome]